MGRRNGWSGIRVARPTTFSTHAFQCPNGESVSATEGTAFLSLLCAPPLLFKLGEVPHLRLCACRESARLRSGVYSLDKMGFIDAP
jgi:hypothetical protein